MILKSAKLRTEPLHKSVSLLPWPMPCLIKTGNTVTGSGTCFYNVMQYKMFSLGLICTEAFSGNSGKLHEVWGLDPQFTEHLLQP